MLGLTKRANGFLNFGGNGGGGITSIPIATDTTLGGIKVGDNLNVTSDGTLSAKGLVNFSTTEFNTGQKWVDGKDIYCTVYDTVILNPNNLPLILDVDTPIKVEGVLIMGTNIIPINYHSSSNFVDIMLSKNSASNSLSINASLSLNFTGDRQWKMIIYYTKI